MQPGEEIIFSTKFEDDMIALKTAEALKKTPGVVLIDEVDLSLHPTWQKRIMGILKDQFPRIQFICATHSPFIIQSLEEGELITLDQPLDSEYSGEGLEDIAEDIMGVVLPQYSEKKRKIYEAAQEYFAALKNAETRDEIEKLDMKKQILMTAMDSGFFSVWMTVFADEPQILLALIEKYPGTNKLCYDESGRVKKILLKNEK